MSENPALGVSYLWLDEPGGFPAYRGILRRIFKLPGDIIRFRLPLFAPHWEKYLAQRIDQGYSRGSLYQVMEHNAHFHDFLAKQGARGLNRKTCKLLESYLDRLKSSFQRERGRPLPQRYRTHIRRQIAGFLAYAGAISRRVARARGGKGRLLLPDALLDGYGEHCRIHRGLSPLTLKAYRRELELFRSFLAGRGSRCIGKLACADIDAFLMRRSKAMSAKSLQSIGAALRSFLRYLYVQGHIPRDLAAAVASPSRFRADLRPKYLPWKHIENLLAVINKHSANGKRDYAILVLLADHGLRAREVSSLRIDDADLNQRCLRLRHRKNGATADLPISERAAGALRDYLKERREHPEDRLFLSVRAPVSPLSGPAISSVVQRRLRAVPGGHGGAYALRHSFAKAMLDRGARLSEIGTMLGHKSLRSTLIYTRVAIEDMREVAENYAALL